MAILDVNKVEVEFYENIDTMPMVRFQKFNKMIAKKSALGDNFNDFVTTANRFKSMYAQGLIDKANVEFDNFILGVASLYEEINYTSLAFSALVKRIGKKEYAFAISETEIEEINKELLKIGITEMAVNDELKKVKKK
jgi:hypothetical protein